MPQKTPQPPEDWDLVVSRYPELGVYEKSPRTVSVELNTLYENSKKTRGSETPTALLCLNTANSILRSLYPDAPLPSWHKDLPSLLDILNAMMMTSPSANPGYPWVRLGTKKREVLLDNFFEFAEIILLRMLVVQRVSKHLLPIDYVKVGLADPFLVMVKNEVKKIGKLPRIITACSAVTEVISRLLLGNATKVLKQATGLTPSCIGLSFSREYGELLLAALPEDKAQSDVPTFDFSVSETEAMMSYEDAIFMYRATGTGFAGLIREFGRAEISATYILSDGSMYLKTRQGATSSGMYRTSANNTHTRARRAVAVEVSLALEGKIDEIDFHPRCVGDDCVERYREDKEAEYQRLGFPLRDYERVVGPVSFCSHDWSPGEYPIPQRIWKSVANCLWMSNYGEEQHKAFCQEFYRHPRFRELIRLINERRPLIQIKTN